MKSWNRTALGGPDIKLSDAPSLPPLSSSFYCLKSDIPVKPTSETNPGCSTAFLYASKISRFIKKYVML